jgi:hypothetical protein
MSTATLGFRRRPEASMRRLSSFAPRCRNGVSGNASRRERQHILFNIDLSKDFTEGFDYERLLADMRTFYATLSAA